jgi:hypothetical protein
MLLSRGPPNHFHVVVRSPGATRLNLRRYARLIGTMRLLVSISVALPFLLVTVGCGGGSGTTVKTSGSPHVTKAAFITQADARCTRGNKKREALLLVYGKQHHLGTGRPLNRSRMADMISTMMLPEIKEEADRLVDKAAPQGDAAKLKAIALALKEAINKAKKNPLSVLSSQQTPFNKANELARTYGFHVCGQY